MKRNGNPGEKSKEAIFGDFTIYYRFLHFGSPISDGFDACLCFLMFGDLKKIRLTPLKLFHKLWVRGNILKCFPETIL
jgi:hypothetical protein